MLTTKPASSDAKHWLRVLVCSGSFAVILLLPFLLLPKGVYWLLAAVLLLPVIPVLESLLLTPLYRLSGRFVYYSNMLLLTRSANGLELHAGTLFDYVSYLRWHERGPKAQFKVTRQLLQGLLALCDDIEQGKIAPGTAISATSYFFSNRTAAKLGFTADKVAPMQWLNLMLVAVSLALRLSLIKGRCSWPDLRQIRHIHTTAGHLLAQRATIMRLLKMPITQQKKRDKL